jgi:regulator of protease activity HflC (stomatin/prohibitin superfamily)
MQSTDDPPVFKIGFAILFTLVALTLLFLIGCPKYNVYEQEMTGKAELARATSNRNIQTLEAKAKMESAVDLASADTIRAHGIASSNRIIGASLAENPQYLTWVYYEMLKETKNQVIYVPTEGSVPITEAGRFTKAAVQEGNK